MASLPRAGVGTGGVRHTLFTVTASEAAALLLVLCSC